MPEQELAVRKTIFVNAPQEVAFRVFTEEISTWWPLASHSINDERAGAAVLECRVGGRVYEVDIDGQEHLWGTVTRWEPPWLVAYTWHPGRAPAEDTNVEVRFTGEGSGTRVEVVHTGWEKRGEQAGEAVRSYDSGWGVVLGHFTEAVAKAA